jgi:heat shock protein HslJ
LVQLAVAGGFVFAPDDPRKYVLNFLSDNRRTGISDCNRINGSWQQEETSLRFEACAAGRSLCPPGSPHNNLALNLRDVVAYEFRAGQLILTISIEGVEMEFESRD